MIFTNVSQFFDSLCQISRNYIFFFRITVPDRKKLTTPIFCEQIVATSSDKVSICKCYFWARQVKSWFLYHACSVKEKPFPSWKLLSAVSLLCLTKCLSECEAHSYLVSSWWSNPLKFEISPTPQLVMQLESTAKCIKDGSE